DLQHREQALDVAVAQADAAMRSRASYRRGRVRAVNAVSLHAQPEPARANRIVLAWNHHARVVVGRVRNAADDAELPRGARGHGSSDCHREHCRHNVVLEDCQLAIWNADYYASRRETA